MIQVLSITLSQVDNVSGIIKEVEVLGEDLTDNEVHTNMGNVCFALKVLV